MNLKTTHDDDDGKRGDIQENGKRRDIQENGKRRDIQAKWKTEEIYRKNGKIRRMKLWKGFFE